MRVLWVSAQPEPTSVTGRLRDAGVAALREHGHEVEESNLYAMRWKAVLDRDDYPDTSGPLVLASAAGRAYRDGTLTPDVRAEHAKLERADAVVLQFPLWWYGMPAILKGWIDRVFVKGYAYGVRDPDDPRRTLRYGEGVLAGKRALVITTTGSGERAMGPRGINGELDQVLFGLLHGTLWYAGACVLPPLALHDADRFDADGFRRAAQRVRDRVLALGDTEPVPYRTQNGGDYDADFVLRPHLAPGRTGLAVHRS